MARSRSSHLEGGVREASPVEGCAEAALHRLATRKTHLVEEVVTAEWAG